MNLQEVGNALVNECASRIALVVIAAKRADRLAEVEPQLRILEEFATQLRDGGANHADCVTFGFSVQARVIILLRSAGA